MTNRSNHTVLSGYDQSLGSDMPPFFRMMYFRYVPSVPLLAASLRRTLEHFPRLAMKLAQVPGEGLKLAQLDEPQRLEVRPHVDWSPASFSLDQLPTFVLGLEAELGQPVLGAAFTPVTSGAVLSASLSHAAGDFCSLYLFFARWSETYKALSLEAAAGGVFSPPESPIHTARGLASPDGWRDPAARAAANKGASVAGPDYTVLHLDRTALSSLRTELASDRVTLTLNEILTAFIAHRYGPAIMGRADGLRLRVPVNVRGVHPLVPPDFIGNAIVEAIVPLENLTDSPEAARQTALSIHHAVSAVRTVQYVESALDVRGDRVELKLKGVPVYNRKTDILSTNLSKMPFHQVDFGAGPPAELYGTHTVYKGLSISASGDGLDVRMFGDHGGVDL